MHREKWAISSPINGLLGRHSSCSDNGSCPRLPKPTLTSLTSMGLSSDLCCLAPLHLSKHLLSQDNDGWFGFVIWGISQSFFLEGPIPGGLPVLPTASASLLSVHKGPWALYKDLCVNLQEFPFVISGTVISGELCLSIQLSSRSCSST